MCVQQLVPNLFFFFKMQERECSLCSLCAATYKICKTIKNKIAYLVLFFTSYIYHESDLYLTNIVIFDLNWSPWNHIPYTIIHKFTIRITDYTLIRRIIVNNNTKRFLHKDTLSNVMSCVEGYKTATKRCLYISYTLYIILNTILCTIYTDRGD